MQLGPFEIWDAIGVAETVDRFESYGYPVVDWVKTMIADGFANFYQRDGAGKVTGYYSPVDRAYLPLEADPREITAANLRASGAELYSNGDGAVHDMGNGALLWEFTTKQNSITAGLIESGWRALDLLKDERYRALVIGNDGERFSIGANLGSIGADGGARRH